MLETAPRRGAGFRFLLALHRRRLEERLRRFADAAPLAVVRPSMAASPAHPIWPGRDKNH